VNGLKDVDGPGGIRDGPQVLEGRVKSGINLTVTYRGRTPGGGPRWSAAASGGWRRPERFCDCFERCRRPQVVEATPGGSGKAGHRPDMGRRPGGGRRWLAVASGGPGSELGIDSQLHDIVYPRHVTNSLPNICTQPIGLSTQDSQPGKSIEAEHKYPKHQTPWGINTTHGADNLAPKASFKPIGQTSVKVSPKVSNILSSLSKVSP
jgi:hypothetical protein